MNGNNWWCVKKVLLELKCEQKWIFEGLHFSCPGGKKFVYNKSNAYSDKFMLTSLRHLNISQQIFESTYDKVNSSSQ